MHRSRLPIAEPCHERFEAMDGRGAERFCAKCTTVVHDLSQMTEQKARELLEARDGASICVRYRADARGSLRFREPPARAFAVALTGLAACTGHAESDSLQTPEDALVCEDASGYTIPCVDAVPNEGDPGAGRDDKTDPKSDDDAAKPDDENGEVPETYPMKDPIIVDDDELMGLIAVDALEPSCPVPPPQMEPPVDDGEHELMGRLENPALDRKYEREQRREERRERRRARRAD